MSSFISWVEIPSIDFDRAVDFYSKVFKMDLKPLGFDSEKMACFPSKNGLIVSLTVVDDMIVH